MRAAAKALGIAGGRRAAVVAGEGARWLVERVAAGVVRVTIDGPAGVIVHEGPRAAVRAAVLADLGRLDAAERAAVTSSFDGVAP